MLTAIHPAVSALAFFQSTQLSLFERFLTQAVSGIDSTNITAGMQNIAYVVLLVGFLWQVYQSALHGGDVRGLGTNLIKYVVTAIVVMNYHAIFTAINQGFVNGGNWINSASGAGNLFDNWASDLKTQFSQVGYQKLWGLVTADLPGLIDAILIIVAYVLYPVVIVIFGFFYILYGSILYIFGPIVIALMPLGAANRLAKSYVENIFVWNAWPILYGGFGALLSAVQMGQIGQMLNNNNFLGGLGNLEGSILIGLASIIYSLAIAIIPFIAKRVVSGEVGSTATALMGAAATALTAGIAAGEGVVAGTAAAKAAAPGGALASGQGGAPSTLSGSTTHTSSGSPANQPAPQQRIASSSASTNTPAASTSSMTGSNSSPDSSSPSSLAESHAEQMRTAAGAPRKTVSGQNTTSSGPTTAPSETTGSAAPSSGRPAAGGGRSGSGSQSASESRPSIAPYRLSTWAAFHAARLGTQGAISTGNKAMHVASGVVSRPTQSAARAAGAVGGFAGRMVSAAERMGDAGSSLVQAAANPAETARRGYEALSGSVSSARAAASETVISAAKGMRTGFSSGYKQAREADKS